MRSISLARRFSVIVMAVMLAVTMMPGLALTAHAASVSDVVAGLPLTADPGTGTTQWKASSDGTMLQSGSKGKANSTSTLTLTFTADTAFTFEYKVSSEARYDKFNIKNGSTSIVKDASGEVDWTGVQLEVKKGDVLTFEYKKDSSGDKGEDTCYIRSLSAAAPLTVTFHNGEETKTQSIFGGKGTLEANSFEEQGKVFAGWASSEGGEVVYADGAEIEIEEDADLYAVWNEAYVVTFDDANGTVTTKNIARDTKIGEADMPQDPSRSGYIFGGWFHGEEQLTADTVISEDITYTAVWTPVTYTLAFDANGGEGSMDSMELTYDVPVHIPENTFTRAGYSFKGWATSSYGSVKYQDKDEIKNLRINSGTETFYAVWEGLPLTLTLEPNFEGAESFTRRVQVGRNFNYVYDDETGSAKFETLNDPVREGYNFKGWYTEAEGGDEITSAYKFTGEDQQNGKTLYGRWAEGVVVTFEGNGGTVAS